MVGKTKSRSSERAIILFGMLLMMFGCSQKSNNNELKFIGPSSRGYSQSVVFNMENATMVFISGQLPINENGEQIGKGDLEKQTEQVFKNIKTQVEKAGGSMNDVVKINCYFKDISEIQSFRNARDKFINLENPPASSVVEVQQLINPDFLIEIDAVAILKK